jgi:Ca2+-binding RTX toxin-like protein
LIRAACVGVVALLALAAPAEANFDSCTFAGGAVTATFTSGTAGTLRVSGGAIQADGVNCQTATTANTDTITVVGDADYEQPVIDLGGGAFAPGATDEGDGSSEIELHLNLGANSVGFPEPPDLLVLGSPGTDRVSVASAGGFGLPVVNLNAGGPTTDADFDVDFSGVPPETYVEVRTLGGADELKSAGAFAATVLRAGPGADDMTCGIVVCSPGPGDDDITETAFPLSAHVSYADAAGPVTIDLTIPPFGGTVPNGDGDGGTDRYFGRVPGIDGSPFDDTVTGRGDEGIVFNGGQGKDTFNGGEAFDRVIGEAGDDTLHGGGGGDLLAGGADDDTLDGGEGNDGLYPGFGDDDVLGGPGNDVLVEFREPTAGGLFLGDLVPNGADDLHGGPDVDRVEYANVSGGGGGPFGRTAPVFVDLDGIADDGESSEGDNVMPDVEDVVGGLGNDTLIGDDQDNVLRGNDGADALRGAGGADVLHGVGVLDDDSPSNPDDQLRDAILDEGDDADGGAGADTYDTDEGDDKIHARDSTSDTLDCGPDFDSGEGDRVDVIDANCEAIAFPVELPPDPPIAPPPPVVPPVVTPPPVVVPPAPPPKIATFLSLPSSRRCASRRKFTVRVRREIRGSVKRVQIFVNGRRVKSVTGRRIALPIDLRGLPKGKIKVRLRVELNDGRVATDTRTYRTCATKKRKGRFG